MSKEISQETRNLANDLKDAAVYDKDTRSFTIESAEDIFAKHLKEGLTLDAVKDGQDALITFANAQTLAFGELSQDQMVKDKELSRTTLKTKVGFSAFESSYDRKKSGTAMGKDWVKYGIASTDVTIGVGRKSTQYKQVVTYLGEQAASVFAN